MLRLERQVATTNPPKNKLMKNKIILFFNILSVHLFLITVNGQTWNYLNTENSGIPSNTVRSFDISEDNKEIWLGTQKEGLAKFDGVDWTIYNTSNSAIPSNNITNVLIGANKEIWITAFVEGFGNQLARLQEEEWQSWTQLETGFPLFAENLSLDETGNLWISHPFFVVKFDGVNFTSFNHTNTCLPTISISGLLVFSIYNITETQRWVGMSNNSGGASGVALMDNDDCEFYTPENSGFPVSGQAVYRILPDPIDTNLIWIGTNGGISSFNNNTKQWLNLPSTGSGSTDIAVDATGTVWTFILSNGISYFKENKWIRLNNQPATSFPEQIQISIDNKLWVATENNGLAFLDLDQFQITTSINELEEVNNFSIYPTISNGKYTYNWKSITSILKPLTLSIINTQGKIIYQEKVLSGVNAISLPPNTNEEGLYLYILRAGSGQILKKGKLINIK